MELNSGPPVEQLVLLTAEPALQCHQQMLLEVISYKHPLTLGETSKLTDLEILPG